MGQFFEVPLINCKCLGKSYSGPIFTYFILEEGIVKFFRDPRGIFLVFLLICIFKKFYFFHGEPYALDPRMLTITHHTPFQFNRPLNVNNIGVVKTCIILKNVSRSLWGKHEENY